MMLEVVYGEANDSERVENSKSGLEVLREIDTK